MENKPTPSYDINTTVEYVGSALRSVTEIVSLGSIDSSWAAEKYRRNSSHRDYDNEMVCIAEDRLVLIGETSSNQFGSSLQPFIWFWDNYLYPMCTLTFYGWDKGKIWRVFLKDRSRELELFLAKPTQVILLRGDNCVSALNLNIPAVNPGVWKRLPKFKTDLNYIADERAGKAWANSLIEKPKTPEGHMIKGWVDRLNTKISTASKFYGDPDNANQFGKEMAFIRASQYSESFKENTKVLANIYHHFDRLFFKQGYNPVPDMLDLTSKWSDAPGHASLFYLLMEAAWFSSAGTSCGRQIRSLNLNGDVFPLGVGSEKLGDRSLEFWKRIPFVFPLYYREIIGDGNCPMALENYIENAPLYQGDIYKGQQFSNDLLSEACSLKQWTIPFGAYVQVKAGPIEAIKLYEIGDEVACVLVDDAKDYFLIWVDPSNKTIRYYCDEIDYNKAIFGVTEKRMSQGSHRPATELFEREAEGLKQRISVGFMVLLSSIIRDFWVVEERQRIFGISLLAKKRPGLRGDIKKKIITYLPRIRWVGDCEEGSGELHLEARRAHFVVGHLRKAVKASDNQLFMAQRYGIIIPEGFTFVRPHRRGGEAQERIYRSRSALQCIKSLKSLNSPSSPDSWFTFELRVKEWLSENGYDVVHLAASRNGDGGVDIQAIRDDEHLLVQCKYWHSDRIHPNVIREMIGTLQSFPEGARGVIVTSSQLTGPTKHLAAKNGIQYIENVKFIDGISLKL